MSIPGSGHRPAPSAPAQTEATSQSNQLPASSSVNTPSRPVMRSKAERKASEELRYMYENFKDSRRNTYLDYKILNEGSAYESSSRSESKKNQAIDVDSSDFEYTKNSYVFVSHLVNTKAYRALGHLLKLCPRIAAEGSSGAPAMMISIDLKDMTQRNVRDLINVLNGSAYPLPIYINPIFRSQQEQEKAIQIVSLCNKFTGLCVNISSNAGPFIECIKENKTIKNLLLSSCHDTEDDPDQSPFKELLSTLGSMHWLENFEASRSFFYTLPVFEGRVLEKLKSAPQLSSLVIEDCVVGNDIAINNLAAMIQGSTTLSNLNLTLWKFGKQDAVPGCIEKLAPAIAASKSLTSLELRGLWNLNNIEYLIDSISKSRSLTHLNFGHATVYSSENLELMKRLLASSPQIVQIFSESFDSESAKSSNLWRDLNRDGKAYTAFLDVCDLLEKNRARALLGKYSTSFNVYPDGEQSLEVFGPAYLPTDVGNLIAENILDLSPNIQEFERVMRVVNRSAFEADLQNALIADANALRSAQGQRRMKKDITTLTTTTTTTSISGTRGADSTPLQAGSRAASSTVPVDAGKPTQATQASAASQDGRIDSGYESDVFIESSDDE